MKRKTNNRNVYVVFAAFIAAGVRGKFRCLAIFFFSFFEELKSILLNLHRLGRISSLLSFPISSFAFSYRCFIVKSNKYFDIGSLKTWTLCEKQNKKKLDIDTKTCLWVKSKQHLAEKNAQELTRFGDDK